MSVPIPSEVNADTRALAELFKAASTGDVVDYEAMSNALGAPITRRRHLIPAALRLANKEAGAIFGNVRAVGYKRLQSQDVHLVGHAVRRRIRRTTRRAALTIERAMEVTNDLPDEAKRKAYAELNTLGLLQHIARDRTVAAVAPLEKPVPVAQVMRATLEQLGVA